MTRLFTKLIALQEFSRCSRKEELYTSKNMKIIDKQVTRITRSCMCAYIKYKENTFHGNTSWNLQNMSIPFGNMISSV